MNDRDTGDECECEGCREGWADRFDRIRFTMARHIGIIVAPIPRIDLDKIVPHRHATE